MGCCHRFSVYLSVCPRRYAVMLVRRESCGPGLAFVHKIFSNLLGDRRPGSGTAVQGLLFLTRLIASVLLLASTSTGTRTMA